MSIGTIKESLNFGLVFINCLKLLSKLNNNSASFSNKHFNELYPKYNLRWLGIFSSSNGFKNAWVNNAE